ncbi:hypothetical protein PsorP6_001159 [Peronosclerospora sorghi]|uniref:Uncharacterized protein n=1 Tax=Peronosclerospora sorghi TaxID=230839 RepID=A0ACC0WUZ0_9STRA|nr:hypothetical protein PsorP6_001159 [Peronosclerospora sorghi]
MVLCDVDNVGYARRPAITPELVVKQFLSQLLQCLKKTNQYFGVGDDKRKEIHHSDDDEVCTESPRLPMDYEAYEALITPATITYDMYKMSHVAIFAYIDKYFPLDQLAAIEANPGLMLKTILTPTKLAALAANRAVWRLLAAVPSNPSTGYKACLISLHTTGNPDELLKRILRHSPDPSTDQALIILSAWDVVAHVMTPTVYLEVLKIFTLVDTPPTYHVNLNILLLANTFLPMLAFRFLPKNLFNMTKSLNTWKSSSMLSKI